MGRLMIDQVTGESLDTRVLGRVVHFKSGGQTSTTSIDKEYNSRMAAIAESQQWMAEEYFMFWEEFYKPMEQAMIEANTSLIADQTRHERERLETEIAAMQEMRHLLPEETRLKIDEMRTQMDRLAQERELMPSQLQTEIQALSTQFSQLKSQEEMIPHEVGLRLQQIATEYGQLESQRQLQGDITETSRMQMETQRAGLGLAQEAIEGIRPVMSEYYKQALTGVDVDQRVAQAQAGVRHGFAGQEDIIRRNQARMGIDPSSGVAQHAQNVRQMEEAKSIAGAGTQAQVEAEREKFDRLSGAMSGAASIAQGIY